MAITPRLKFSIIRCAGRSEDSTAASVIMRIIMTSSLWHRAALFALLPAAFAADDARQQLIDQLNQRAFGILEQRAKTVAAIQTRQAAAQRQTFFRNSVLRMIGGLPQTTAALHPKVTGTVEHEGFRIEKVMYESLPDFFVTANLYLPAGAGPFAAVVMTPGHSPSGKAGEFQLAANLARNGIAAFAYDPMSEGERLQYFDPATKKSKVGGPTGEHSQAELQTNVIGEHISRYFVWDAMRAIDYLATRHEIDTQRIGAFGCSGGGTVTAYLAALEPRVKAAASACYITAFQELLPSRTGVQEAEQSISGFIASGFDFGDWVEAAAPKPYAIVSTTEDMFPFEGARRTFEEAKRWYGLYDAADRIEWITGPGGHGALTPVHPKIIAFFLKHLKSSTAEPVYSRLTPDKASDLWCTAEGQVGGRSISDVIRERAEAVKPSAGAKDFRTAAGIAAKLGTKQTQGYTEQTGAFHRGVAIQSADGTSMLLDVFAPADGRRHPVLLVITSDPRSEAVKSEKVLAFLSPRPWPAGSESAKAPIQGNFYLLSLRAQITGRTLVGLRADDIISAVSGLSALPDADPKQITAYASGPSGLALLHAAAIDDRISHVVIEDSLASFRMIATEPLHRNAAEYMVPGVLRSYDIPDLIRAIAPRKVEFLNQVDATGEHIKESYRPGSALAGLIK
jgi:cephalosporin-C deacetylase-like acetyl esterase